MADDKSQEGSFKLNVTKWDNTTGRGKVVDKRDWVTASLLVPSGYGCRRTGGNDHRRLERDDTGTVREESPHLRDVWPRPDLGDWFPAVPRPSRLGTSRRKTGSRGHTESIKGQKWPWTVLWKMWETTYLNFRFTLESTNPLYRTDLLLTYIGSDNQTRV